MPWITRTQRSAARARIEQEIGERVVRLVAGHAVQVELALQRPVTAAQLRQHVGARGRARRNVCSCSMLLADLPGMRRRLGAVLGREQRVRSSAMRCRGIGAGAGARCVARLRGRQPLHVGERLREVDVAFGMLARRRARAWRAAAGVGRRLRRRRRVAASLGRLARASNSALRSDSFAMRYAATSSRYASASSAAMQPVPAEVTACR